MDDIETFLRQAKVLFLRETEPTLMRFYRLACLQISRLIKFFLRNESVRLLAAVTNLGAISYVVKTEHFDWDVARDVFNEAVSKQHEAKNLKGLQEAAEYFLKNCHKANIVYEY